MFFGHKIFSTFFTISSPIADGVWQNRGYENKYSIQRSVRNDLQREHPLLFSRAPAPASQPRRRVVPAHAPGRRARGGLDTRARAAPGTNLFPGTGADQRTR